MTKRALPRREFLSSVAALGILSATHGAPAPMVNSQNPLPEKEEWLNEPKHWRREGSALICTAGPKTDFWRKTFYGYIADNGHFLHRTITGDFTASVKFSGHYHDLYDQAGLMVRLDESNWMKCGVEFVDGKPHMSAVFTRDYSDWSTFNLAEFSGPLWLRVVRKGDSLDIFHSLDGKEFVEDRVGYLIPAPRVMVGPMLAAPEGQGFEVRFEDWSLEPGVPHS